MYAIHSSRMQGQQDQAVSFRSELSLHHRKKSKKQCPRLHTPFLHHVTYMSTSGSPAFLLKPDVVWVPVSAGGGACHGEG